MKALLVTNAERYNQSEPLGLLQLSAVLKRAGHEVRLAPERLRTAAAAVAEFEPDIVGYSVVTIEQRRAAELNRELKKAGKFLSVFGGPHVTFFPQFIEKEGVDVVCRGEGEGAILDLAHALDDGGDIREIANLWVKTPHGEIHRNAVRPLVDNLDSLPVPDRDAFYTLFDRPAHFGVARFMASRGCPYNCTYCFNESYFDLYAKKGRRVRWRSPEHLVAEIADTHRKYPLQTVAFGDDCFPNDESWLAEFGARYGREVGVPFVVNQRAERLTQAACALLREAGCHAVLLGIESGNERLRREMLRRHMTNDEIRTACRLLRESGIKYLTNNLVGIPEETVETALETLDLNLELRPIHASVYFFQPFPQTELCKIAVARGLYDGSVDECGDYRKSGKTWKIPNKKKLIRLRSLMGPVVLVPFLRPLVPLLAHLPLNAVYGLASKIAAGYSFKFRLFPLKLGFWGFTKQLIRYLLTSATYH